MKGNDPLITPTPPASHQDSLPLTPILTHTPTHSQAIQKIECFYSGPSELKEC